LGERTFFYGGSKRSAWTLGSKGFLRFFFLFASPFIFQLRLGQRLAARPPTTVRDSLSICIGREDVTYCSSISSFNGSRFSSRSAHSSIVFLHMSIIWTFVSVVDPDYQLAPTAFCFFFLHLDSLPSCLCLQINLISCTYRRTRHRSAQSDPSL